MYRGRAARKGGGTEVAVEVGIGGRGERVVGEEEGEERGREGRKRVCCRG